MFISVSVGIGLVCLGALIGSVVTAAAFTALWRIRDAVLDCD